MVDFAVHGGPLIGADISVIAASVDSVADVASLKEGLRVGFPMFAEVDPEQVGAATGARYHVGERTMIHATAFLLEPDGSVNTSLYSSGPIGRFTASEILRKVAFERSKG